MRSTSLLLVAAATVAGAAPACTAKHAEAIAVPDYRPVATEAAPPNAALYAGCLADAVAHDRYAHAHDPGTRLLLFTCGGDAARAFYDGLAAWSAKVGSQFEHDGRTFRSTDRVHHDLFGVDYCDTDGTAYECVVTLNTGDFLTAPP
ncbi:MAG TPA: hypothetical protein VHE35_28120 [Kofleriaceae bacterium]|nr:hypothetical protein [Kofleriaceae bacterium]